jgi:hypothetical protein
MTTDNSISDPSTDNSASNPHRYTIDLPDGRQQVYEADTPEELLTKVNNAHQESVRAMKTRENENADLRRQIQQPESTQPAQQPTSPTATPNTGNGFNNEYYYQLLARDPIGASEYLDHHRYGFNPKDKFTSVDQFAQTRERISESMEVQEFHRRVPDFPATQDAAYAVNNRINQLGMGVSANSLELAWHQLVKEGTVQPIQAVQSSTANPALNPGVPVIPPVVTPGSTSTDPLDATDPYSMPLENLKHQILTGEKR